MTNDLDYQKRISEYSLKSLKDVKRNIDRHKYSNRYNLVLKEINKREELNQKEQVENQNIPFGCKLFKNNDDYKLVIDNTAVKKDKFLVIFLSIFGLIWIPATLFTTLIVIFGGFNLFLIIWTTFAWFGSIGILRTLIGLNANEIYIIKRC